MCRYVVVETAHSKSANRITSFYTTLARQAILLVDLNSALMEKHAKVEAMKSVLCNIFMQKVRVIKMTI